jgi:hypothetical protein
MRQKDNHHHSRQPSLTRFSRSVSLVCPVLAAESGGPADPELVRLREIEEAIQRVSCACCCCPPALMPPFSSRHITMPLSTPHSPASTYHLAQFSDTVESLNAIAMQQAQTAHVMQVNVSLLLLFHLLLSCSLVPIPHPSTAALLFPPTPPTPRSFSKGRSRSSAQNTGARRPRLAPSGRRLRSSPRPAPLLLLGGVRVQRPATPQPWTCC